LRKLSIASALVVLQAGIVFGLSSEAVALPVLAGHVTCTISGKGKFEPKLKTTGTGTLLKMSVKGHVSACTGGSYGSHTVTGGSISGSGTFTRSSSVSTCTNFQGALPSDTVTVIKMTVTWKLSPAIAVAPSHILYTGTYSAPTSGTTMALDLGALATPPTTTTVGASYGGSTVQNTLMNVTVPPITFCPVGENFLFPTGTVTF
jgi:hypothetical protein